MKLMAEIQENYPNFDISDENIERHYKFLKDFDFKQALRNVEAHIKSNDFIPKISHIRGHLADVNQSEQSKMQAMKYDEQLNEWSSSQEPPPEGYWNTLRNSLRGGKS